MERCRMGLVQERQPGSFILTLESELCMADETSGQRVERMPDHICACSIIGKSFHPKICLRQWMGAEWCDGKQWQLLWHSVAVGTFKWWSAFLCTLLVPRHQSI